MASKFNNKNNLNNLNNSDLIAALISVLLKDKNVETQNELIQKLRDAEVYGIFGATQKGVADLAVLKQPDGKALIGVCTSEVHGNHINAAYKLHKLPFRMVLARMMLSNGKIQGVVINPFTQGFVITPALGKIIGSRPAQEAEKAAPPVELTDDQINQLERLKFEEKFLPQRFYQGGRAFLQEIIDGKAEKIDTLFEESYKNKLMYLYLTEEFEIFTIYPDDDTVLVRISMPTRELREGCAIRLYLLAIGDELHYYVVRLDGSRHFELIGIKEDNSIYIIEKDPNEGMELYLIMKDLGLEE